MAKSSATRSIRAPHAFWDRVYQEAEARQTNPTRLILALVEAGLAEKTQAEQATSPAPAPPPPAHPAVLRRLWGKR